MKKVYIVIIILIILGIAGYFVFAKSDEKSTTTNTTPSTTTTNNDTNNDNSSDGSQSSTSNTVGMAGSVFSPKTLTIKKGTKVTWTNNDNTMHNVIGEDSGGPSSETLNPGDSYSFTFNDAGTFEYECTFHSGMTGTVIVQ